MEDFEVLREAADVLQRKCTVVVQGGMGRVITPDIAHAMLTAGIMAQTAEFLRELAGSFEKCKTEDADSGD